MKPHFLTLLLFLPACDHIDSVGDKVNDLKDLRKESTQGIDGMKLDQILDGAKNGPTVNKLDETQFYDFIEKPGKLQIVSFAASWDETSKQLAPVLQKAIKANSKVARLGNINIDQAHGLIREEKVTKVPEVRFYIEGKMVHSFTGGQTREAIENMIATHSESIPDGEDYAAQINSAIARFSGKKDKETTTKKKSVPQRKSIDEAMKPMDEEWLPPGMSRKK